MTQERPCGAPDLYRPKRRSRTGLPSGRHTIVMRNMSLVASNITCITKPKWIRSLEGMLPETWNKEGRLQGGLPKTRETFSARPTDSMSWPRASRGAPCERTAQCLGQHFGTAHGSVAEWISSGLCHRISEQHAYDAQLSGANSTGDARRPGMPAQRSVRVQWRQSHGNKVVEDHVQARSKGAARGGRLLLWLHVQSATRWEKAS